MDSRKITLRYITVIFLLSFQYVGLFLASIATFEYYYSFKLIDFMLVIFGLHICFQAYQLRIHLANGKFDSSLDRYNELVKDINSRSRRVRRKIIREMQKSGK
jgi:hypothetical protein